MFSYGTNNVIDFTNMKGAYGIFAPNASGKSTLWDALSFCMFDKCSRASFVKLPLRDIKSRGDDWARVDGFDPEEKILYVHDEDSGEEYSLEADELVGTRYYELKEIK